ncbi:LysR family transcriptional regulator [Acinetobacter ihumii]|uniref:LysR family transcriptional regulator n=1 Tax=Acinetobacter ihumii TaxID=2483802 RepID=UPI0010307CF8|nr:LysR family transcriptional regulator [Acinetobacter ihumii]
MSFKTTLQQWALLEKVIESGSFAQAANETFKSQSAVSYNLERLQESLGVQLLTIKGRKAELTANGELLLRQVRPLLRSFSYFENYATTLTKGIRGEINLIVDTMFPRDRLFEVLRLFHQQYPKTKINFTEIIENTSYFTEAKENADLMILAEKYNLDAIGEWLMDIRFVAVAHSAHPIHKKQTPLSDQDLMGETLVYISDQNNPNKDKIDQFGCWTFTTVETAIEAILNQVGYGWLPEQRIQPYLDSGVLKKIHLEHGQQRMTALHLFLRKNHSLFDEPLRFLIELFKLER